MFIQMAFLPNAHWQAYKVPKEYYSSPLCPSVACHTLPMTLLRLQIITILVSLLCSINTSQETLNCRDLWLGIGSVEIIDWGLDELRSSIGDWKCWDHRLGIWSVEIVNGGLGIRDLKCWHRWLGWRLGIWRVEIIDWELEVRRCYIGDLSSVEIIDWGFQVSRSSIRYLKCQDHQLGMRD